ncbi:MAG: hypothetical protein V3T84_04315 [Phycisphaerales bacterium]
MAMMRYCLECGYSRQGLSQDAVCPECGEADVFEQQREVCASLAARPLSLLWRVMTLRRLPKGWWVVFADKHPLRFKPWQIVLTGVLILFTFCALGLFVRIESTTTSFLYDVTDPQRSVIAEVSVRIDRYNLATVGSSYTIRFLPTSAPLTGPNLRTGYKRTTRFAFGRDSSGSGPHPRLVVYLLVYTIAVWLLSRFVWLGLIARDRRASGFRHAARQTAAIYVAHVVWLVAASLVGYLATLTMSLVATVPLQWINIPWVILLIVMTIIGPAVIWWRVMSTDTLRYEFPRRIWAGVLLTGCTLVAVVGVRITWPWFW